MSKPKTPGIIRKLDEAVINRIAAGEVIQRPANALKELLENSLDAGSTNITVVVSGGGLQLLQINDNGTGIRKDDLAIVCERFTTSKLREFNDLTSISTYGFRGEALASISHVAKLTILTKTGDSQVGFKVEYKDGKPLAGKPKPCAANQGTQITVEDLFYNVPTRRRVLKSAAEEFNRIADVMTKYSIHNSGKAGFTLKKVGDSGSSDLRTQASCSLKDNIAGIYGVSISRELLDFKHQDSALKFSCSGVLTNANYNMKKLNFLLFINHRLVENSALKKAIEMVYNAYLPKGTYPFVYLSLEIAPENIDVNVHPTKHEVHFLHQDEIIEKIQQTMDATLLGSNKSRTFYTQSLLPGAKLPLASTSTSKKSDSLLMSVAPKSMVRTDAREQKLDKFLVDTSSLSSNSKVVLDSTLEEVNFQRPRLVQEYAPPTPKIIKQTNKPPVQEVQNPKNPTPMTLEIVAKASDDAPILASKPMDVESNSSFMNSEPLLTSTALEESNSSSKYIALEMDSTSSNSTLVENSMNSKANDESFKGQEVFKIPEVPRKEIKLASVKNLRKQIQDSCHSHLRDLLQNHTYVGCANREFALIQHQTKLYITNIPELSRHLFYQLMLLEFGNASVIKLEPGACIQELALIALDMPEAGWSETDGEKDKLARGVLDLLLEKKDMLFDYFSMEINDQGQLIGVPLLLEGFVPDLNRLPLLILRLATEVNWDDEEDCFRTFCQELASFYQVSKSNCCSYDQNQHEVDEADNENGWKKVMQNVLFPAMKKYLKPPAECAENRTFFLAADLPDLYKVFERC